MDPSSIGSTFAIILDYNGGVKTDSLVTNLSIANQDGLPIHVLDNGSDPEKRSQFVTHETGTNLGIGSGINHCIKLAEQHGAQRLCFIVNDLEPQSPLALQYLEYPFIRDDTVAVSVSVSPESNQALLYPWMIHQPDREKPYRIVPHADKSLRLRRSCCTPHPRG
ncbi:MAG: hypothetical protein HYS86_05515 [Candidatus Chisholmbacteria bacterium]|nr:hypothetical protein [Candidatus Chisholmbacteria bacterium]